jgi:capsular polysaccharide biosynthesis protein
MAKKIKISRKLASEILSLSAEVADLLQNEGISLYRPVESSLQKRIRLASRDIFNKLMGFPKGTE